MVTQRKLTRIQRRDRLEKLFDKGKYVYFTATDDGDLIVRAQGGEVEGDLRIWVRPPSPLQREMVVREAQATRARAIVTARDPDTNEWITIKGFIAQLTDDGLIQYCLDLGEQERIAEARRDVLNEPEWADFNQLRDAIRQWEDAGSPRDDPEWESLLRRDEQYGEQLQTAADELRVAAREAMKLMPRPKLEERAFEKRVESAGTSAFLRDYEAWMLYYACRDDEDHTELYFDTLASLRSQPDGLQNALADTLASFVSEAAEAKNSQGVESGSASSAPPGEPATSDSSTQQESTE